MCFSMFSMKKDDLGQMDPDLLMEKKVYVPDKLKIDWSQQKNDGFKKQVFLFQL